MYVGVITPTMENQTDNSIGTIKYIRNGYTGIELESTLDCKRSLLQSHDVVL